MKHLKLTKEALKRGFLAKEDTDSFSELSSLEEKISKSVQNNVKIKQLTSTATSKESQISGLSEDITDRKIKLQELQVYIENAGKSIASENLSSDRFLKLKKEFSEKEAELQGIIELLEAHTSALPIIVDELKYHNLLKVYFIKNIASIIFDEKIDEIVKDVGDKLLTLFNTTPLIDGFTRKLNVAYNGIVSGHVRVVAEMAMEKVILKVLDGQPMPDQNSAHKYIESLVINMAKSNDKYGEVTTKEGIVVTIVQPPYVKDIAEGSYYLAAGIDASDNEYIIHWNCVEGWLGMSDKSQHCNWDEYYIYAV